MTKVLRLLEKRDLSKKRRTKKTDIVEEQTNKESSSESSESEDEVEETTNNSTRRQQGSSWNSAMGQTNRIYAGHETTVATVATERAPGIMTEGTVQWRAGIYERHRQAQDEWIQRQEAKRQRLHQPGVTNTTRQPQRNNQLH